MVSNRRLEYGFNGYQAPATPRAPRSARRGCPISKKVDDHKMGAFDLLATVAGELLLEKDVHPSSSCSLTLKDKSSVNEVIHDKEWHDKCKVSELDLSTQEKCGKSCVVSKIFSVDKDQDNGSEFKSKDDSVSSAIEVGLSTGDRSNCNQEDEGMLQYKDALLNHGNSAYRSDTDLCSLGGPVKCTSDNRKVVSGDDDDNLSGCIHLSTMMKKKKPFNSVPRICGRRIRKILASKYWNAPKSKAGHFNRSGGDLRIAYSDRIGCYRRQRSQRTYPFKKRFFDLNCVKNFDEKDRNLAPEEDINMDVSEDGLSSSKASQRSSQGRRNSHVKFRIKSFRVPELFIEVAETATIGSLKRMVMEALSAILGGGVRIGVLLRGKKVRDDGETLLQSGISHDNQPDALGFTLEPNYSVTPFENPGPSHLSLPSDSPHPYAGRAEDSVACHGDFLPVTEPHGTNSGKLIENDCHDSHAPVEMPIDDRFVYSRALAVVPTMNNGEALPEIPVQQQLGNSEVSQRRARRPFSVAEVEALVQAVEKLGTGRWRDVKVRAFDDAKHRTYVDLKDKWKTLVRTARISPQQRRGEPVPQELLDRVLAAHAYWSHRQSKPQQHQVSNV